MGKFDFLLLLVEELGPWIVCVLRGNHKAHRANKAIKELWLLFVSLVSFLTTAEDHLQAA